MMIVLWAATFLIGFWAYGYVLVRLQRIEKAVHSVGRSERRIEHSARRIEHTEEIMSQNWDALKAQVSQMSDVVQSAGAVIDNILAKLNELGDSPTKADIDALAADVSAERDSLAQAVARGTAAAPTP